MPELTEPQLPSLDQPQQITEAPPTDSAPTPEVPSPVQLEKENPLSNPSEVWALSETRPSSRTHYPRRRLPVSLWLTALLVPYAIVATIGIAYLFQQRLRQKEPHILESIPDQGLYEDFLDGRRHEVFQSLDKAGDKTSNMKIIPPNEPIGQEIPALKLGETRRIGQLEITPQLVTKQSLRYALRGGKSDVAGEDALVLTLHVKNAGTVIFRPDDETFNRAFANDSKSPVYTFLEMANDRYYGAITDPIHERLSFPACESLLPGETGNMTIVALRSGDGKKQAVSALKPGEQYLWRVHLRRGKEEITLSTGKQRSVWLTTVVPISFQANEVK
ncbi:MAG TPA: hypothetical protein PLN21_01050 [Gemmatales bacterium]|nr:hypothetical protein [Gemmatales bacterium]